MGPMGYQMQYPGAQAPAYNSRIIRRPLTDAERQLPGRFYKTLQNGLRGLAAFCLILFVLNTYVLSSVITDAIAYDTVSTVLSVFMIVFGLVAVGMSVNALILRKKLAQTLANGTVVEVFAPAYRSGMGGKGPAWTVGPVSIMPSRGIDGLIAEGQPTSVVCVPSMKAAISINNCGLKVGTRIMCPPNLEMMATPVGPMPAAAPVQAPAYPPYGAQPVQTQPQATYEEPPPPPTD
ncbi:MAG: hypothetical protein QG582_533 [Candidatus Thermoplasmatota archaeon]|nr:hypothetical protein [Candidatus Thermoplasmatota archaeon]